MVQNTTDKLTTEEETEQYKMMLKQKSIFCKYKNQNSFESIQSTPSQQKSEKSISVYLDSIFGTIDPNMPTKRKKKGDLGLGNIKKKKKIKKSFKKSRSLQLDEEEDDHTQTINLDEPKERKGSQYQSSINDNSKQKKLETIQEVESILCTATINENDCDVIPVIELDCIYNKQLIEDNIR